ncbi:MAG: glycine cleavage system protein GcvH [Candidatus Bathyarchaeota archaeon]|nr:glycine cleavage system protein GcvH [Candidatus Bathyarchaeota archaeon]MDH5712866.1 glycine cleavage system protein GcvH [Candidatus Bathyarchaeota archaeon]
MKNEDSYQLKALKWTFRVPKDLLYNENDCWAKIEDHKARVGITDFLQSMATDIIFVEFKDVGTEIEQLDEVASFESTKTILDLISPVSGVIVEVNEKLLERPELVNQDPYGEGWFAVLRLKNFESDRENLLDAQKYFEVLKRKVELEKEKLGKLRQF